MTDSDAPASGEEEQHTDPLEAVDGMETVEIECTVGKQDLEECDGWETEIELKEPAHYDGEHLHLPGFDWECPECGNPHNFAVEGIWVSNLV